MQWKRCIRHKYVYMMMMMDGREEELKLEMFLLNKYLQSYIWENEIEIEIENEISIKLLYNFSLKERREKMEIRKNI